MIVHLVIIVCFAPLVLASDEECCEETANPYIANCSDRELEQVPQCLDIRLQILDLTKTRLQEISGNDFARYPKLETLIIRDNHIQTVYDETLSSHMNLINVDFSFNSLQNMPQLPSSVERLDLSGNSGLLKNAKMIAFPILKSLRTLSLASNRMKKFPNLDSNGHSLEEIDIRKNNVTSLSVNDLASLCKLKRLHIDGSRLFRGENESCACHAVLEWVKEFQIVMDNFTCPDKVCSIDLRQYRNKRENCNRRSILKKIPYLYIGIAVVVALPVALFLIRLIRCCKQKNLPRKPKSAPIDDLRYT